MKNLALAKKLDGYIVDFPTDYAFRVSSVIDSKRMQVLSDSIVGNIEIISKELRGKPINAIQIVGVILATINKMPESGFTKSEVLTALDLVPKYLTVMISNEQVRQEAINFFNGETEELRNRSR